jgi:hypothetical protein
MNLRILTAGLSVATALLTIGLSVEPVSAQDPRSSVLSRNRVSPNYSYQQGRTRIYVTKRSWLDAGTEVLPGERKYTDYAIPPTYTQNTIDQLTGRPWTRQPLVDPFDLPGYGKGGYGY